MRSDTCQRIDTPTGYLTGMYYTTPSTFQITGEYRVIRTPLCQARIYRSLYRICMQYFGLTRLSVCGVILILYISLDGLDGTRDRTAITTGVVLHRPAYATETVDCKLMYFYTFLDINIPDC